MCRPRDEVDELAKTRTAYSARLNNKLRPLIAGGANKTIARELGIRVRTVEVAPCADVQIR
jgi:FixJ family two-component response regulator